MRLEHISNTSALLPLLIGSLHTLWHQWWCVCCSLIPRPLSSSYWNEATARLHATIADCLNTHTVAAVMVCVAARVEDPQTCITVAFNSAVGFMSLCRRRWLMSPKLATPCPRRTSILLLGCKLLCLQSRMGTQTWTQPIFSLWRQSTHRTC